MKPNILFLVIDALPYDRCYSKNKTSKTPNLDSLIERGVFFDQAISSADATPASFASIFTALFPFSCATRGGLWYFKLNPKSENYIKILKEYGYHAYATLPELTAIKEIFYDFETEKFPFYGYRLYDGLGEQIIKKLKSDQMVQPWIYFIHLMDGHKPISYPKEFDDEKYGEDEYDRLVSSIDIWIGKILDQINFDETLIVLTADHGDYIRSIKKGNKRISFEYKSLAGPALKISKMTPDFLYTIKIKLFLTIRNLITQVRLAKLSKSLSLHEKRLLTSARSKADHYLFDDVIRVPLIFSGYNIPSKSPVSTQVRSVDIFPSIAEIIGMSKKNNAIDGRSVIPLINGFDLEELPAYIETSINEKNISEGGYGIRTSKFKYFRRVPDSDKKPHLYDLKNDPLEENNIAKNRPDVVSEMEKMLNAIKGTTIQKEKDFIKKRISQKRDKLYLTK